MRRTLAILAPIALALTLTGCGSNSGTVTKGEETESATTEQSAPAEEIVEEEAVEEPASTNPTFGDTYTWPDGLAITISAPQEITLSNEYMGELYDLSVGPVLAFDVTVHNGTDKDVEAIMINTQMTSGSSESEAVFATEEGLDMPSTTILPGKDLTWKVGYVVADPADLQLSVSDLNNFSNDKIHFTN